MGREQGNPRVEVVFREEEWRDEVERFGPSAAPRLVAQKARPTIEGADASKLGWKRCKAEGALDGTNLPACVKLYAPLDAEGASAAPFGLVFQLQQAATKGLILNFLAFGERHPDNPRTRSVYERAHKRLHGRYP